MNLLIIFSVLSAVSCSLQSPTKFVSPKFIGDFKVGNVRPTSELEIFRYLLPLYRHRILRSFSDTHLVFPNLKRRDSATLKEEKLSSTDAKEAQPDLRDLKRVLEACRRAVSFFRKHLTQMNFDAVIGSRIAEAQFKMALTLLENKQKRHKDDGEGREDMLGLVSAIVDLRSIYGLTEELNAIAEPFIKSKDPDYYSGLGRLLQLGFWEVPILTKHFNTTPDPLPFSSKVLRGVEQLNEDKSDRCISEAGRPSAGLTERDPGNERMRSDIGSIEAQEACSLSEDCWAMMTKPGYTGYSLTHQVFYLIIGLQAGCGDQLELFAHSTLWNGTKLDLATLLERLCYSVLTEAVTITNAGFPEARRDLFMEQGALCGLLGYRDFFRSQWLTAVLSWQRPPGCFGDVALYDNAHKHMLNASGMHSSSHARVKREESAMAGSCLAHRTTVALGYLSLYVRYMVLALFT